MDNRPGIVCMDVSSNLVLLAFKTGLVNRLSIDDATKIDTVTIVKQPKSDAESLNKCFVSPTGQHALISTNSGELYYLHVSWLKPAKLKMRGSVVEAVGWGRRDRGGLADRIMLGCKSGELYELSLVPGDKEGVLADEVLRPVFTVGEAVCFVHVEPFPHSRQQEDATKFFVLCTTARRIFQFVGGPTYEDLFRQCASPDFFELSGLAYSCVSLLVDFNGLPNYFAWLTGSGVYHGKIVFADQAPREQLTDATELLPSDGSMDDVLVALVRTHSQPLSLALLEFHFVLVFDDVMVAISRISEAVVQESPFPAGFGRPRRIVKDYARNSIWIYSSSAVLELLVDREARFVAGLLLDKGNYEAALEYAESPEQRNRVYLAKAEAMWERGNLVESAAAFAQVSGISFEDIALRFVAEANMAALKVLLLQKLVLLPRRAAAQRTLLATWLVELMLSHMNEQIASGGGEPERAELQDFLREHHDSLDSRVCFNLFATFGRDGDIMLFYASLVEAFDRIISYHISSARYDAAIDYIINDLANHRDKVGAIVCKYGPLLIPHRPDRVVHMFKFFSAQIGDPVQLLPALTRYADATGRRCVIHYLEHCIERLGSEAVSVHNMLLALYVEDGNDAALETFIGHPSARFDKNQALRLCTQKQKRRACVQLYSQLELFDDAVQLALLDGNISLAKSIVERASARVDDEKQLAALQKKLLLRIAQYMIRDCRDESQAIELLQAEEWKKVLKLEDILPFFPPFETMAKFKAQICDALDGYNLNIAELEEKMLAATHSADLIRTDIRELKNRYGFVHPTQKCDACSRPVLSRAFVMFACQHLFHFDCLVAYVMPSLAPATQQRVYELIDTVDSARAAMQAAAAAASSAADGGEAAEQAGPAYEALKSQLDDIVASECVYCGKIMIDLIDKPFVTEFDAGELAKWRV